MSKRPKIVMAPQIKQRQVANIQDIFLEKILGIEGALISDESRISDFLLYSPETAIGPGKEKGKMQFQRNRYVGPQKEFLTNSKARKDPDNWKKVEIEMEPDLSRNEVITKTKELFGVDISSVYGEYLVDVLLYIAEHYVSKKER